MEGWHENKMWNGCTKQEENCKKTTTWVIFDPFMHLWVNRLTPCSFVTGKIRFPDPENVGLVVKINNPVYSEDEILQIKVLRRPFLKIQYGRHIDIWANANIDFLTPYTITFPKIYSLANPQKNPTKVKI